MSVINDKELAECITEDQLERGYTKEEAKEYLEEYGEKIVSRMWDAYSEEIENSQYLKEKDLNNGNI